MRPWTLIKAFLGWIVAEVLIPTIYHNYRGAPKTIGAPVNETVAPVLATFTKLVTIVSEHQVNIK